ncbi:MAG: hypothetical protein U1D55_02120 [Phycisphaerae bacterium]
MRSAAECAADGNDAGALQEAAAVLRATHRGTTVRICPTASARVITPIGVPFEPRRLVETDDAFRALEATNEAGVPGGATEIRTNVADRDMLRGLRRNFILGRGFPIVVAVLLVREIVRWTQTGRPGAALWFFAIGGFSWLTRKAWKGAQ